MAFPLQPAAINGVYYSLFHLLLHEKSMASLGIILHGVSAVSHILAILLLLFVLIFKRYRRDGDGRDHRQKDWRTAGFSCFRATLFACLFLSIFNLFIWIFDFIFWRKFESDEKLETQLDLATRTVAWFSITAYVNFDFSYSIRKEFPILLRSWWGFYFLLSCTFIVLDIGLRGKSVILPTHIWVLDFISVLFSSFLCYAGFFGKQKIEGSTPVLDPFLKESTNGDATPSDKSAKKITPFANANLISVLTFSWMSPLLKIGNAKTLDLDDVPQLAEPDSVECVFQIFENKLKEHSSTSNRVGTIKLVKGLFLSAWREVLLTAIFSILYTLCSFVGPYLIDTLVQYLGGHQEFANEGYALVSAFFIAKIIECISQRHWFFRVQQVGIRAQAALVAIIYKKGLSLSSSSKRSHTSGEIINFMTVDVELVGNSLWYLPFLWLVPLQITLALLILYKNVGLGTLATLMATILVVLINIPMGRLQEKYQGGLMSCKDIRMRATSEILKNMRILKLQGWEMKFLSKIVELRKKEENWLKKFVYTSAITMFVFWGAPTFVAVATFVTCMLMGIPLQSGKILSAIATFKIMQETINLLPETISMFVQTKVSLNRIASFLCLEDLQPDIVQRLPNGTSEVVIDISNGNFSWDLSSENPTLKDLNLQVSRGMNVAVCGTVGSGKSSLLSCILGEVPKISGTIRLCGDRAYVTQSPWIQSGTIEQNILFGREMDRERYDRILEACSLKKDLEILSFGDQTVIGERGINLSGGQKQRIQIARALYQDADVYLFDDPFSAVDAHTGSLLFKECIIGFLASKTVIYVTHQLEFLPAADLILVMKDGKIKQAGKYNDILNSGTDFMELISAHEKALSVLDSMGTASDSKAQTTQNSNNFLQDDSVDGESNTISIEKEEKMYEQNNKTDEIIGQKGQLVQEEEREKGTVSLSVYWKYITTSYKGFLVPFILLAHILFQILQIGSNYWMAWAAPVSKDVAAVKNSLLIIVYVALALGSSLCILIRALLLVTAGYKTATILFDKMHIRVFRAPMSFFDSTPSGRILNRASTDQSEVDTAIPDSIGSFSFSIIELVGTIAVMSLVAWQVFIVFIPATAICIWYQQYYIGSSRELARLIGVCKAPCIQHFAESLSGSATIRSFDQESRFLDTNFHLIDGYSRPKFHNAGAMEWLCFRLDMFSSLTFAFSLVFLVSMPKGVIDPGIAGLAVTYGLNLNMQEAWLIWNLCTLENKIISVERLFQYFSIPAEPPLVVENNRPCIDWPARGEVDIYDLQVRYSPHMPYVLRGITCTFPGGKKTGIVGRTGSGKSTLIQTLFRIVDPSGGQILIDGIDIMTIGLHDLRSRLSIIPQDPTMFEGTVRSNLDPLEEYTDAQIWEALDKCQLGDEVRRKEGKLYSAVSENGENWSMGQRQLVCLGRVILKRSKILVLDEATASVDTATDNLIQQTIRQQFSESTVITIAHRITSVLESDFVLVLNDGIIAEHSSPAALLENKSSLFAKLVKEYGTR